MKSLTPRHPRARAATVLAAMLLGLGLPAAVAALRNPAPPAAAERTAPWTAALRVAIDPDTGQLVPAPAASVAEKAAALLNRSDEGLREVRHPDGRVSVNLEGRFMSASLARVGDDGAVETTCVESPEAAAAFLDADRDGREVR